MHKTNTNQKGTIIIYTLLLIMYIVWRICFTLNPDQMTASVMYLSVDIVMCFSATLFVISFWKSPICSASCEGTKQFSIDVFVPTYNENCEMLESTLCKCIDMDYPHKTYLLDDGKRPEMKVLAERLGAGYITREKNTGAKAGNLNNALQYTQGELIAIFDADFRPEKNFLTRLVESFYDEKVAVVQTPQYYYNTDSFQHRLISKNEIYSEQNTFMHLVLPARNSWNAAYWIGTCTLLRRKSIESIGGFSTDSVTEDVLTSMFLHSKGLKIRYIDEPLAYGLAPTNISEYCVQRLRWAKGAFQIIRSHNPLFKRGLSFMQRLFYFSSVSHFFEGGIKITYYLFPALFFLFGITPIKPYSPIVIGMLIYVGFSRLIIELITNRHTSLIMDEVYSVINSFIYLSAIPVLFFSKNIRFKVTPKDGKKIVSFRGIIGPIIIFGFNFTVIILTIFNPYMVTMLGVLGWICFGWCLYTGGVAFTACLYCFEPLLKKSNETDA